MSNPQSNPLSDEEKSRNKTAWGLSLDIFSIALIWAKVEVSKIILPFSS